MKRTYLTARFDVTDLTVKERNALAFHVGVQSEGSDDEPMSYPDVAEPRIDFTEEDVVDTTKIKVGDRFALRHDVDRFPHFIALEGAKGTITVAEGGLVCLKMDDHLPGAETWDNEIVWSLDDDQSAHEDLTREME